MANEWPQDARRLLVNTSVGDNDNDLWEQLLTREHARINDNTLKFQQSAFHVSDLCSAHTRGASRMYLINDIYVFFLRILGFNLLLKNDNIWLLQHEWSLTRRQRRGGMEDMLFSQTIFMYLLLLLWALLQ